MPDDFQVRIRRRYFYHFITLGVQIDLEKNEQHAVDPSTDNWNQETNEGIETENNKAIYNGSGIENLNLVHTLFLRFSIEGGEIGPVNDFYKNFAENVGKS